MASGGQRGNAGRVADPAALRRERSGDSATWTVLSVPEFDAPAFPLSGLSDREAIVWARLWLKPQATEWKRLGLEDEVALYVRYLVEAEQPDASGSVRTLVKQHQELLGLSTAGLNRLRWQLPAGDAPVVALSESRRSSSRARLKVVGNDG